MKTKAILISLIVLLLQHSDIKSQTAFIGPMFHYNIASNSKHKLSWGFEFSFWTNSNDIPKSIDLGFEFEGPISRIYSELQAGLLFGCSLGYVAEINEKKELNGGFQGSIWAAIFGGVDLRYRNISGKNIFAPGAFFKYPFYTAEKRGY